MRTFSLASGSSGNAFYVEHEKSKQAILIDLGISCKKACSILESKKINPENIKGIFVTHEHSDHTKGIDVFARKFQVPIFLTKGTYQETFVCSDENLINFIKNDAEIKINGLRIRAFSKPHDCLDPVSFSVYDNDKTVSIITDIGHANKNVCEAVSDSDLLFMEANHDIDMLKEGPYPIYLKKRILADDGHLSNYQSSLCLLEHSSKKLKKIILSHLSEINNTPNIALKTAHSLIKERRDLNPELFVSERHNPSEVFRV
jgi:phosphoribosyl 1,2-cyclic phosphodiesterase